MVDGVSHQCTLATEAEAEKRREELRTLQYEVKMRKKQKRAEAAEALRVEHAEHRAENARIYKQNSHKDFLARGLLTLALRDNGEVGVAEGVEYATDMHAFFRKDSYGFSPERDAKLDDMVKTMGIELKMAQSPHRQAAQWNGIHYGDRRATIVIMMYTPYVYESATPDALAATQFWIHEAYDWWPKSGQVLRKIATDGNRNSRIDECKGKGAAELKNAVVNAFKRREGDLIAYGHTKRRFSSESHRRGQAAIDALENQVLRPIGARLMPASGGEGGPDDRRLIFEKSSSLYAAGSTITVQIKRTYVESYSIQVSHYRLDGSIRQNGQRRILRRPYSVDDGVKAFIYVNLDHNENVQQYWFATVDDLIGSDPLHQIITDDHHRGTMLISLAPLDPDRPTCENNFSYQRAKKWLNRLGNIISPQEAEKLRADTIDAARVAHNQ